MAIAFVTERAKGGGSVLSGAAKTFTISVASVTVGNTLIVALYVVTSAAWTFTSITDNAGNTYTNDQQLTQANGRSVAIFSAYMAAAPTTLTVTNTNPSGSTVTVAYKVEEFSGIAQSGRFDTGATTDNGSVVTIITGPGAFGAGSGELGIAGYGATTATTTYTPGSTYTQAGTPRNAATDIMLGYNVSITNVSSSANGQIAPGSAGIAFSVIYKAAVLAKAIPLPDKRRRLLAR